MAIGWHWEPSFIPTSSCCYGANEGLKVLGEFSGNAKPSISQKRWDPTVSFYGWKMTLLWISLLAFQWAVRLGTPPSRRGLADWGGGVLWWVFGWWLLCGWFIIFKHVFTESYWPEGIMCLSLSTWTTSSNDIVHILKFWHWFGERNICFGI